MSWGYLASLTFELSPAAWKNARATKVPAAPWPRSTVAAYFEPRVFGGDTLAELLARKDWRAKGDPAALGVFVDENGKGGRVQVRLLAHVDRSGELIQELGCLPGALALVASAGGKGTLLVVTDGSAPEPGWSWAIAGGKVRAAKLAEKQAFARLAGFEKALGVGAEPAPAPVAVPVKAAAKKSKPRKSNAPHLDRLDGRILEVRYQPSPEPQRLHVRVQGRPKGDWSSGYAGAMKDAMEVWSHGAAGGTQFAPEAAVIEHVDGPLPRGKAIDDPPNADFRWTFRVASLDALAFVAALHRIANSWSVIDDLMLGVLPGSEPQFYPSRIEIIGERPLGATAVRTADVLRLVQERDVPLPAFGELPFAWKETAAKKAPMLAVVPKTALSKAHLVELAHAVQAAGANAAVHPACDEIAWPRAKASASRVAVTWNELDCPAHVLRGPLKNALRWFHHRVSPIASVTWSV